MVISEETRLGAAFVNARRTEQNFRQLKVVCAHIVGGDGNELTNWQGKLSSTDLREREAKARRLSERSSRCEPSQRERAESESE